jgi:hypothetical protein
LDRTVAEIERLSGGQGQGSEEEGQAQFAKLAAAEELRKMPFPQRAKAIGQAMAVALNKQTKELPD